APLDDARARHASARDTKEALDQCLTQAEGARAVIRACAQSHLIPLKQAHSDADASLQKISADDPARAEAQRPPGELGVMLVSAQTRVKRLLPREWPAPDRKQDP